MVRATTEQARSKREADELRRQLEARLVLLLLLLLELDSLLIARHGLGDPPRQ
jgi:hypothetical protein